MTLTREQWMQFLESRQEQLEPVTFETFSEKWNRELKEYLMASGSVSVQLESGVNPKLVLN